MNEHELGDELSNQKLTNQFFFVKSKSGLDAKLVETIMLLKESDAFENYFESIDELYEEGSIIGREAEVIIETDRKGLLKLKEVNVVKEVKLLIKR